MKLETVKVVNGDSYTIINATDYDDALHDLYQEQGEVTRESIAKMSKADLRELLEMHGLEPAKKIGDMRAQLIAAMFI